LRFIVLLPALLFGLDSSSLLDESLEELLEIESELKVDIGSRDGAKEISDSLFPVDVITAEEISRTGLSTLPDILRYFIPSFNSPETHIADGTDHVRAFTLRGMSPNQILILVNGKRVHTSSLLHMNGTIGKGNSNVDLEMIPLEAISRIEILRDGSAAQYGSDAISGAINIKLKGAYQTSFVTTSYGKRIVGDGEVKYGGGFIAIPLSYDGFANLSFSARNSERTDRSGFDKRLEIPQKTTQVGLPQTENYTFSGNIEVNRDFTYYTNFISSYRNSEANVFFRLPDSTRTLFPNGFLPITKAEIENHHFTFGIKESRNNLKWDLSNTSGYSSFLFDIENTINFSLGEESPIKFNVGNFTFFQNSTNFDLQKQLDSLSLAGGLEFRHENYKIEAGDIESSTGTGSEGFRGFKERNGREDHRNSYAIYLNSTFKLSEDTTLEGAGRFEEYADFGSTENFKLAFGNKLSDSLLFRTSVSTGFKAPSLAQKNYSHISTFSDTETGNLVVKGTAKSDSPVAKIFREKDLDSEKSEHITTGILFSPTQNLNFNLDFFYTKVRDRILLSGDLLPKTEAQKKVFEENTLSYIRIFTNSGNTETHGIDFKADFKHEFESGSRIDFRTWYSYAKTNLLSNHYSGTEEQKDRIERGQPKHSLRLLGNFETGDSDITLNLSRYGSYYQMIGENSYKFEADWTLDTNYRYKFTEDFSFSFGGINVFDNHPNKWDGLSGNFYGFDGVKPYSRFSPYGYSGAFYYIKAEMRL
jgi:iron complex outermembrane receptor protein